MAGLSGTRGADRDRGVPVAALDEHGGEEDVVGAEVDRDLRSAPEHRDARVVPADVVFIYDQEGAVSGDGHLHDLAVLRVVGPVNRRRIHGDAASDVLLGSQYAGPAAHDAELLADPRPTNRTPVLIPTWRSNKHARTRRPVSIPTWRSNEYPRSRMSKSSGCRPRLRRHAPPGAFGRAEAVHSEDHREHDAR